MECGSFVYWHINLCGLINVKAILVEEQQWYSFTHSLGDKGVYTFPRGNSLKVNVAAHMVFELTYLSSTLAIMP